MRTVSIATGRMHAFLLGLAAIVSVASASGRGPFGPGSAADLPAVARWSAPPIEPASDSRPPAGRWQEGKHYDVLDPPVADAAVTGKVRVIEFFWYACPHCYALEHDLNAWLRTKPAAVEFVRVPVAWRPAVEAHARLFYTLRELGRADLDDEVFTAIHEHGNRLVADNGQDDRETYRMQLGFAVAHGIPEHDFSAAWSSASVAAQLERARRLAKECRVDGVPAFLIDGKYLTSGRRAGRANLIAVVSGLAAREAGNEARP